VAGLGSQTTNKLKLGAVVYELSSSSCNILTARRRNSILVRCAKQMEREVKGAARLTKKKAGLVEFDGQEFSHSPTLREIASQPMSNRMTSEIYSRHSLRWRIWLL
jgi:hypothetical protein